MVVPYCARFCLLGNHKVIENKNVNCLLTRPSPCTFFPTVQSNSQTAKGRVSIFFFLKQIVLPHIPESANCGVLSLLQVFC